MFVDITGKTRLKVALHVPMQEGQTPQQIADIYSAEGFDAVAVASKGIYLPESDNLLSSCECKIGNPESTDGEYTVLGIGMTSDPCIPEDWENMKKTSSSKAAEAIKMIHQKNGYAILCGCMQHKNIPDEVLRLTDLDAIEVFNSIIGEDGTAGLLCDISRTMGGCCSAIASGIVCVEAKEKEMLSIVRALKAGRFYCSEGDSEVHISALPSGRVVVECSPASKIEFFTASSEDCESRVVQGEDLVRAEYVPLEGERFVRAEITDMDGLRAWTNYIEV